MTRLSYGARFRRGRQVLGLKQLLLIPVGRAGGVWEFWIWAIPFPLYASTPVYLALRWLTPKLRFVGYAGAFIMFALFWMPTRNLEEREFVRLPWTLQPHAYAMGAALALMAPAWIAYGPSTRSADREAARS